MQVRVSIVIAGQIQWYTSIQLLKEKAYPREVLDLENCLPINDAELMDYYIYVVKHEGRVVYIGKGCGSRYKHVTSGCSHVLELNRLYFLGITPTVYIHRDNMEEDVALLIEKQLIREINPEFNVVHRTIN